MSIAAGPWHSTPRSVGGAGEYEDLADVPASEREGRLEELVSATHVDMAVRLGPGWPAASFRSRVRRRRIEDLVLVDVRCDPCSGMRGQRRAARTESLYLGVTVARRGRTEMSVSRGSGPGVTATPRTLTGACRATGTVGGSP